MTRRFVGFVAAAAAAMTITGTLAAAPATAAPNAVDYTAIVALNNCSGSVVRPSGAANTDKALVLTNGHCVKFMAAGEVILNQPSARTFTLLNSTAQTLGTLTATKLAYATMTDTDLALYQLRESYADIESRYRTKALTLNSVHPKQGADIRVVSGYWKRIYSCKVDAFVHQLKEANWTWKDSLRYTSSCNTIGGTSGSPIIDTADNTVVGVNNTGNENGGRCTQNNPCEVDPAGNVTVRRGINYGQQTFQVNACMSTGNNVDPNKAGCTLPKPRV
ncbi:S1 family peptidase [Crossiella cryophila]|uniref:V8-like Glu-specific endopeptidase n=1 Tax=Crossiella cryophila TaxID=43355 RepID=A0A7W7C681_9PSEU|nr:serine protease [Crossiella cryophila]MBB4675266.1 V8-like Glu-specific endopeptidase [Crossiella cryophila]